MMKYKYKIILGIICLIIIAVIFINFRKGRRQGVTQTKIINPVIGDVSVTVTTTGVVEPQNRLEIKPSIGGRIEKILVNEGDRVTEGEILAWMSSTERAALVDAARSRGEEALKYWKNAYKKTPIISPIDGEVIVRSVEPGQTVTAQDAVLVLSDRLVISGQFDETDIGRVRIDQKAFIELDAYPEIKIEGIVDHVAYESKLVSNVTIYDVDILPKEVPEILRSGMSVTVEVVEKESTGAVIIPSAAIHYDNERQYVLVQERRGKIVERDISVGLNNEKTAEILSGLTVQDNIVAPESAYLPKRKDVGTNPFMPFGRRKK